MILSTLTGLGAAAIAHASVLTQAGVPRTQTAQAAGFLDGPLSTPAFLGLPALPSLPIPTSGLPILNPTATPCLVNCAPPTDNPGLSTSTPAPSAGTPQPDPGAAISPGAAGGAAGGSSGGRGSSSSAGGLNIGPPPSVLAIGPGTAISFGKAPFLWPLFAALDILGLAAVVTVVRKTWSRSAAD